MSGKEIVKQDDYSHLKIMTGAEEVKGLAPLSEEMMLVPRIKLVQPLSDEVSAMKYQAGILIDSISKDILCEDGSLEIVPIMYKESRLMYHPIDSGGGVKCMSADGKTGNGDPGGSCLNCQYRQWAKKYNEKTKKEENVQECSTVANIVCIPVNVPVENQYPIIATFMKTSFPTGKKLINSIYQKRVNPWHFKYEIFTELVKGEKGTYYEMRFKPSGKAPEAIVEYMESIFDLMNEKGYDVHYDEGEMEAEAEAMADADSDDTFK